MLRRGTVRGFRQHIRNQHKKLITLLVFFIIYLMVTATTLLTGNSIKDYISVVSEQQNEDAVKRTGQTRDINEKRGITTELPLYLPHRARIDSKAYSHAKFDEWCYSADKDTFTYDKPFTSEELASRGCKKRLPTVLIIGAKSCDVRTLSHFLSFHPSVALIQNDTFEINYFGLHRDKGYEWYRNQLLYITNRQVVVEKSPEYLTWPHDCAQKVHDYISPKTKIIIALCDPVQRAVSDYYQNAFNPKADPSIHKHYHFASTFEQSVIDNEFHAKSVNFYNKMVDTGVYVKHIVRWMEYFPKEQIYLMDEGILKVDPYKELHKIEMFLGIAEYATTDHFYFDEVKRYHCMRFPYKHCMTKIKSMAMSDIDEVVLDTLYEFYRPYDNQLSKMFDRKFSWMEKYEWL